MPCGVLCGIDDLDCPQPVDGGGDEEDLDRDVGIDMRLREEREHLAAGELFDRLGEPAGFAQAPAIGARDRSRVERELVLQPE